MNGTTKKPRRLARRIALVILMLFGVGAIVLRFTVFGVSNIRVDAATFDGTAKMAARLAELGAGFDRDRNTLERVPAYALIVRYFGDITDPPDERSRIIIDAREAEVALERGESRRAVEGFLRVRAAAAARPALFDGAFRHALAREIAVAWLRVGEQENCIVKHNRDSCIFPIAGRGVHTKTDGARAAAAEYIAILDEHPDDLTARWLLNVAGMALGDMTVVPEKWRIKMPASPQFPRFPQIAAEVGLDLEGAAGGVIAEDFDGDGDLDLMVSRMTRTGQLRYLRNDAGHFIDATEAAGLNGLTGGLYIIQTDYDNDGRPDVLVPRGAWNGEDGDLPLSLLHNDGGGHFSDVTAKAGLVTLHPVQSVVWADFDNDGRLDLFVGRESFTLEGMWEYIKYSNDAQHDHPSGIPSFKKHPAALYHNNGDGTFTDVAASAGTDVIGFIKGVTVGDYDNDGNIDIYISRYIESNILLHNDGNMRFSDATKRAGVAEPIFSFPTWFFDYDNDGRLDLFVGDSPSQLGIYDGAALVAADFVGRPLPPSKTPYTTMLYHNNGDGTFSDVSATAGVSKVMLPMGSAFGDLDNDGWPDFYLGTGSPSYEALVPNRMFRNVDGKRFEDVTFSGGFGHLQKGHAVVFADLDEDGDQDVYVVNGGAFSGDNARNALFENPGTRHHWLKLTLEGRRSNRPALGARIRVTIDENGHPRDIYSTVATGGSFGAAPFRRELGLGDAASITAVEVRWPAGGTQRFTGLQPDHAYRLIEDDSTPRAITTTPFRLH